MAENFDNEAFFAALNSVRLSRQLTWKDVAEESGVNASTLTRMGQGANPDVNGFAALIVWSKLKAEMFMPQTRPGEAEPIAKITALLRADPKLKGEHAKLMEDIVVSTYNRLRSSAS